jgi:hypothetical protein
MKGAMGCAFVDGGGGNDRRGKTHAEWYAKYSLKGFASAKNAGPVRGGYPADLGGSKENGGGGASAKGAMFLPPLESVKSCPLRLPEWAAGSEPREGAC